MDTWQKQAWTLYREYLQAETPTREQTFLAEEALKDLASFTDDPIDWEVNMYNLASFYHKTKQDRLAVQTLEELLKETDSSLARVLLGSIYYRGSIDVRDRKKALDQLEQVPRNLSAAHLLYLIYTGRDRRFYNLQKAMQVIADVEDHALDNLTIKPYEAGQLLTDSADLDLYFGETRQARRKLTIIRQALLEQKPLEQMSQDEKHLLSDIDSLLEMAEA